MKKHQTPELSKLKKLLFSLLAIVIPFLFLILLEIVLRLFGYGQNFHLFINHPNKNYSEYMSVNPSIGEKYFRKFDATGGTNDIFLKKKSGNCYRIFVLGSSSVVGFPYCLNLTFTRILQARLQAAYPDKKIEIINTAITAINSFTLLDFMNEIVDYKPDAVLIYAGHNEFYGAFGIGSQETLSRNKNILKLHFTLIHLRIYQLMRNAIYGVVNAFSSKTSSSDKGTLMKRMVADAKIAYKSEKYNIGISQFTENMSQILSIAQKRNVPVFISELISNVKDLTPFGSIKADTFPLASEVYNQAKQYEANQDYSKAKQMYYYAKDLDCVRFRASEEINDTIHKIANKYGANLIPTKSYFEQNSINGLIGNNLVTEHLHPNIQGYFLIAEAFYDNLVKSKLISEKTDSINFKSASYIKNHWGYTELDSLAGLHKINKLKANWPFVSAEKEYDYRKVYKPKSFIDSLALTTILYPDVTVEGLHRKLGDKYMAAKDYYNAYREYNALICINPYWSNYYLQAGNCLLNLNDLHSAMLLFKKFLEFDTKNYFPYFALGEICVIKKDFENAILYYNMALKTSKNSKEKSIIIAKLYIAYAYSGESGLSQKTFTELKQLDPSANYAIPKINASYTDYIPFFVKDELTEAKSLMMAGNYDEALKILQKSLNIWDTPLANKYIGDILFIKRDNSLLYYYLKAYPDFNNDPDFLRSLCIAYLVNRKHDNASKIIADLKSLNPNYPEIPKLENLLKSIK
jgi:tetratricopeptide (TPR) repeat protein